MCMYVCVNMCIMRVLDLNSAAKNIARGIMSARGRMRSTYASDAKNGNFESAVYVFVTIEARVECVRVRVWVCVRA